MSWDERKHGKTSTRRDERQYLAKGLLSNYRYSQIIDIVVMMYFKRQAQQ